MRSGEGGNEASSRIWAMAKAKGVGKTGEKRQIRTGNGGGTGVKVVCVEGGQVCSEAT